MKLEWGSLKSVYMVRKNNRSPESYYLSKFRRIQAFFAQKEFTQENVDTFLVDLQTQFEREYKKPISASTYNKYVCMLREIGKLQNVTFMSQYYGKKPIYKETEKLTEEEVARLLSVERTYSRESDYSNFRWKLIIKVLLITTLRPGENGLRDITWENFINNKFYLPITKNGRPQWSRLPPHVADEVRQLRRFPHGYVFGTRKGQLDLTTLNMEIRERCKLAGIKKKITARSMRGSGITSYLNRLPIQVVAKISNHKNINILYEHYYASEDKEIDHAVNNNAIDPTPPSDQDVINEYRKVSDRFRHTLFRPITEEIEALVLAKLNNH